ncbi:bile acid:sodium symporter family protein [Rhodopirellula sp. MGV]|uniref:bile acid:sodium symporter family protein n=1 Tax=Rhodopirellula sp. MGV TaxID=2023130 RepID=UPI0013045E57|nr:bile acid:sodium symporter family protein [Rhodopirellula sp. MGV]
MQSLGVLLGLVASSIAAYLWPWTGLSIDPFYLSKTGLLSLVALTMFSLGVTVKDAELVELRNRPFAVFLGVVVQCTAMPTLAWLVVNVLSISGPLAYGVMLCGCVPGAMASNVLTMTAKGNVSYSVSLTCIATLLSPLTVPFTLLMVAGLETGTDTFQPIQTATILVITVVIPTLAGYGCRRLVPKTPVAQRRMLIIASSIATVALLWIIASVVAGNRDRLSLATPGLLGSLLLMNLLGYCSGLIMGKLSKMPVAMRRALTLEVGMQNAGLGTGLAASLFGDATPAQIPTAAYTFGCMLTGTLLAAFWARLGATHTDQA